MKIKSILPVILISLSAILRAQYFPGFSTDFEKFPEEILQYWNQTPSESEQAIINQFVISWKAREWKNEDALKIMTAAQRLYEKRARSNPHFIRYLQVLNLFRYSRLDDKSYDAWQQGWFQLLDNDRTFLREILNYLNISLKLIRDRGFQGKGPEWKFKSGDFRFGYEGKTYARFNKLDLTCIKNTDSISIYGTRGVFYLMDAHWEGREGKVSWERSGYDPNRVHAMLSDYSIDMNTDGYRADSVIFRNSNYFDFPVPGKLQDKIQALPNPDHLVYPSFESYDLGYKLPRLYDNITYSGGLSMTGKRMIGRGTRENKAHMGIYWQDTLRILARSEYFTFSPQIVRGVDTRVTIPVGTDSITHPNMDLIYRVNENALSLNQSDDFASKAPYYNSYHKVEMNFEQLYWELDKPEIVFRMKRGSAIGFANFRSANMFDPGLYASLQGMDLNNPLVLLRRYSEKVFSVEFTGRAFAKFIHKPFYQVQQTLMRAAQEGFIVYDNEQDIVTVRQKLYDYIYASVGYIDYDQINFISEVTAPNTNAVFNLKNNDININGIPQINLSTVQNVSIYPGKDKITLKENRSFTFDGIIEAGLFRFYGNNFYFSYDSFKINLQDIDSLTFKFKVEDLDDYGRSSLVNVQNSIQDITGELIIDDTENKSGRKDIPVYPIFNSKENSYVYYNQADSIYKTDEFYFEIYPFSFDSLDNFSPRGLQLQGKFVSAGILPDLEQNLKIKGDNSLGFTYDAGEQGIGVYGGKGVFYNTVDLSNNGLMGTGRLDYLTSTSYSEEFLFHPDSVIGEVYKFENRAQSTGVKYPMIRSANDSLRWYPYLDRLLSHQHKGPYTILNDSTQLEGSLVLTPDGITASGDMLLTTSEFSSNLFRYEDQSFRADTADFRLKSIHTSGFTVLTENMNTYVDFKSRSGLFRTNGEFTRTEFPENQYVSELELFRWDIDGKKIAMGVRDTGPREELSEDVEAYGPRYISLHPAQDSFSFVSPNAEYNYSENIIHAYEVKLLKVADALIYPGDGEVIVDEGARVRTLKGARILADDSLKMHNIFDATVDITGRYAYTASGYYDYIDETDSSQTIYFDKIKVDEKIQTVAEGLIPPSREFYLSPDFACQGKVFLEASRPHLTFDGGTRILVNCDRFETEWVRFRTEIDPDNVRIPISRDLRDMDMNPIHLALFVQHDSANIYPAFFGHQRLATDNYVIDAHGEMYFDKATREYRIAAPEKHENRLVPENYLSISREQCEIYGEGLLYLGVRVGQIRMRTPGYIRYNLVDLSVKLEIMLALDFFIDENVMAIARNEMDSLSGQEAFDLTGTTYRKALAELVGLETMEKMQAELGLYGRYQSIPGGLDYTMILPSLKLQWNPFTSSYRSVAPVGISIIDGKQVNIMSDARIELSKRRGGDMLDIHLEPTRNIWYYYGYTRGVMQVLSSNRDFNFIVSNLKTRQRQMKTKRNEIPFIYVIGTAQKRASFLRRFEEGEDLMEEMQ